MPDTAKLVHWVAFAVAIIVIVTLPVLWVLKLALALVFGLLLAGFDRWAATRSLWRDD